tara:strand:+ start:807 stop:1898 length:1092 start_codon:yes stop_codon:yes gene_type:complete
MALKYLSNIDLNGNSVEKSFINNSVIHPRSSDPVASEGIGSAFEVGQVYYNTSQDKLKIYDGSTFIKVGATYSFSSLNGILTLKEDGVATATTFTIAGGSGITLAHTTNTVTINVANSDILSLLNSLESSSGSADETITIGADAGDTINFRGSVVVDGNLTVSGTTTTLNTATLDVEDLNITVGKNATTTAAADGAGLTFGAWSSGTTPTFTWVNSTSKLTANKPLQATSFHGNLTGDVTGNVTGNVTGDVTGNLTGNVTGDLTGDVTGDVTGNLTGEVSTLSNHFHKVALADSESSVSKTGNTYTITHNLGTRDVLVQVTRVGTPYDTVYVDVERLLTSTVKISFGAAVTDGDYKVLVFRLA